MDLDFLSNESFFSSFLRIGLFFGAIFQIVCIGFVIFDHDEDDEKVSLSRFCEHEANSLFETVPGYRQQRFFV